jgi:putative hydrolase of the HAD superfamily
MILDNKSIYSFKYYLFDLDNTIYNENQYLFEVYKKIALTIEKGTSLDHKSILDDMKFHFLNFGRENIFNSIIVKYNLKSNSMDEFLKILRTLRLGFKLEIFPEIEQLIFQLLEYKKRILVVTNGNLNQQKNKIDQINWKELENHLQFVLADEIERKPSPELFKYIKEKYKLEESESLMIGDSDIDKKFADNSNIEFLNVSDIIKYWHLFEIK